jgi:pimeloyl-ACP methyl ester carboxylesterase
VTPLRIAALSVAGLLALGVVAVAVGASQPRPDAPAAPAEPPLALEAGGVRHDLRFPCGASVCAGWLFLPDAAAPPLVVMGHGFAGTRDVALEPFARAFAARGIAAFVFDYRGFGASGGGPRQLIDPWRQLEDWAAALAFVREHPELDGTRVALWGSSLGGGHAIIAAARDSAVRAVVAQAPLVDTAAEGEAAALGAGTALRLLFTAWADCARATFTDEALLVPAIAAPGGHGLIVDGAAQRAFETLVAPRSRYRNAVAARSLLTFDDYNPAVQGAALDRPLLLIASRGDRFASFAGAEAFAAAHPKARIAEISGDHFDVYAAPQRDEAARLAADFLARELLPAVP